jgi:hypothetical protein
VRGSERIAKRGESLRPAIGHLTGGADWIFTSPRSASS